MSKRPDNIITLSETLSLCEYKSGGYLGFWIYDETRGMNLSMRAKTEREAFVEVITYYQERLKEIEDKYAKLNNQVSVFVEQFATEDD